MLDDATVDVSIALEVKNNDYDYGLNKIVNVVHELFVHLHETHSDYLAETSMSLRNSPYTIFILLIIATRCGCTIGSSKRSAEA